MKTCIYLRKSRADAEAESRGEGETLERHKKILLEVAKKQKLSITEIYKEIVSGETIASRPVMQRLLSEVEQGIWDAVLVIEIERLARGDSIDQGIMAQAFKFSNTKIITPQKTFDPTNEFDEEYFEFNLFMSRREYKTINRRLQMGRVTSVKEGKFVGNVAPYGYMIKALEKEKGNMLIPHPDEAPIVKLIFDLYTNENRIGVSLIVRRLNELNIPSRKGYWVNSTIQHIIRNPVYIGKIRWNARKTVKTMIDGQVVKSRPRAKIEDCIVVDGKHEPIVDVETFNLANEFINSNRARPNPKQVTCKSPLSGLVECAVCNHKMVRRPYQKRGQADVLICPYTHCINVSAPLHLVENTIINILQELGKTYRVESREVSKHVISIELLEKSKNESSKEIETIDKQIEKTHDLLEQGIYDIDTFLSRTKTLAEKKDSLKFQVEKLNLEIKRTKEIRKANYEFAPIVDDIINKYYSLPTPEEKNNLLKQVIEKVTYLKRQKNTKREKGNEFEITVFPRIKQEL